MNIDHVYFYVNDAIAARDWFVQKLGFQAVGSGHDCDRVIEVVNAGSIYFVLGSARHATSAVTHFLQHHPPGVSNIAFCVDDIEITITAAVRQGAILIEPIQTEWQAQGRLKWATIAALGDLRHTIFERVGTTSLLPQSTTSGLSQVLVSPAVSSSSSPTSQRTAKTRHRSRPNADLTGIDHVVLNVAKGDLAASVAWYERVLGFHPQQGFEIQTNYSGLCSRVLRHPQSGIQLPINEPASENSQIQEFLDLNRGPGVQHIALETDDLIGAIAQFRHNGLSLLHVPPIYYTQLRQRPGLPLSEAVLQQVEQQQILVDWQDAVQPAVLLQTFTQPIFNEPTFFFELIQRQFSRSDNPVGRAQGFGEGNFRALFEAIEREQMKRGSLQVPLAQETAD